MATQKKGDPPKKANVVDRIAKALNAQGARNREQAERYPTTERDRSQRTQREVVAGEGVDTQDVLDAAQEEYGGILGGSGRRGSLARANLSEGQSNQFEDALTSGAYQRLLNDSSSIGDINVQNELSNLGIDWKAFAQGTKVTQQGKNKRGQSTGDRVGEYYEDIDMEAFQEYLQNQANPFAVLRGEQAAVAGETARAAGDLQSTLSRQAASGDTSLSAPPSPIPSLLSGVSEPANQQRSVKRV